MFWFQYTAYNGVYKTYAIIALIQQLVIIYPYTWMCIVLNIGDDYNIVHTVSQVISQGFDHVSTLYNWMIIPLPIFTYSDYLQYIYQLCNWLYNYNVNILITS